jgi:hypothetical protein
MKKIIVSMLALAWMALPASAQKHQHKKGKVCPAATCTDHSYDEAYSASKSNTNQWMAEHSDKKDCPAATCTDHSYDEAYSGGKPVLKQTGSIKIVPDARPSTAWNAFTTRNQDNSYSFNDYTYYGRMNRGGNTASDPYNGDNTPAYDGAAKNGYRNMRANNESEPLPASNGR